MPQPFEDIFILKLVFFENFCIGNKFDIGSVRFFGFPLLLISDSFPFEKVSFNIFSFAIAADEESGWKEH